MDDEAFREAQEAIQDLVDAGDGRIRFRDNRLSMYSESGFLIFKGILIVAGEERGQLLVTYIGVFVMIPPRLISPMELRDRIMAANYTEAIIAPLQIMPRRTNSASYELAERPRS